MDSVDWTAICRRIVARQRGLFAAEETIEARTRYEGRGEGGDMTLELDRRCEDIVFEELDAGLAAGPSVLAISEERGEVAIGGGEAAIKVVIDPIDGSMNVRRMIPAALALDRRRRRRLDGRRLLRLRPRLRSRPRVRRETRRVGATVGGRPVEPDPPDHGLEVVGLESAEPSWVGPSIAALEGKAYRLRVVGSIAITMSWVAAGRIDAMFSARPCRSVDAAASQLVVTEAGGAIDFGGITPEQASLDLDARYTVAAVRRREHLETILEAQAAGPAVNGQRT